MKLLDFRVGDRVLKIECGPKDRSLADMLERESTWEPWQLELYRRLIRPDWVCYDVGGNIGTNSLAMAHYASGGHVYAFEPVASTYSIFLANLKRNDENRVKVANIGLSNTNGEALIAVDQALLGDAHQVSGLEVRLDPAIGVEAMRLRRLDDWRCETQAPVPDLVKIDVEGFELEVFEGGAATLFANPQQIVIVEFGIVQQRTAGGSSFPAYPKDLKFFEMLQSRFKNIFLIGRDCQLYPVNSYAELRVLMMRGYPVDDLLCCQTVPLEVADLIARAVNMPHWLVSGIQSDVRGQFAFLNRGDDGWALKLGSELGAVSAVMANVVSATTVTFKIEEAFPEHAGCALTPVFVVAGDRSGFPGQSVTVRMNPGINWILLEVQHAFSAAHYFKNPIDTRQIGFRYFIQ